VTDGPVPEPDPNSDASLFYSGAVARMLKLLVALGLLLAVFVTWRFGMATGLGFTAGVAVSFLNFRSLNHAVQSLANGIVQTQTSEGAHRLVFRFLVRYLLAGLVAYVIFNSSFHAFRGFLFGLCTPVAAMLSEAALEAYTALRRGY
jgi:hypothetical protein